MRMAAAAEYISDKMGITCGLLRHSSPVFPPLESDVGPEAPSERNTPNLRKVVVSVEHHQNHQVGPNELRLSRKQFFQGANHLPNGRQPCRAPVSRGKNEHVFYLPFIAVQRVHTSHISDPHHDVCLSGQIYTWFT